jgi:hypothetical protein
VIPSIVIDKFIYFTKSLAQPNDQTIFDYQSLRASVSLNA